MNKLVITGFLAIAAMFAGSATAAEKGKNAKRLGRIKLIAPDNKTTLDCYVTWADKDENDDGVYTVYNVDKKKYLYAGSSDEETAVTWSSNKSYWIFHKGSTGWSITHTKDGANTLSQKSNGVLYLSKKNAGGRENKDQIWQVK